MEKFIFSLLFSIAAVVFNSMSLCGYVKEKKIAGIILNSIWIGLMGFVIIFDVIKIIGGLL